MISKSLSANRRHRRGRSRVQGTAARPRLNVSITSQHVIAQVVDDSAGKTVAYSSSMGQKLPANLAQRAVWVGKEVAKKAKQAKVKQVVFDRGSHRYHGRVKVLAEAAREEGLKF